MAARNTVRRLVRVPARRVRRALFPEYEALLRDLPLAFESITAAHRGIADLQIEQRALRDRLDATLLLAEGHVGRLSEVDARLTEVDARLTDAEAGVREARRLNLRIAELTDVVTEIVLPLHDRDIDPAKLRDLAPETY
jgi:hypothetical protein